MPINYGIETMMQNYYFVLLLPWLLTFAIVFGLLAHYKIPKSKSARAIISIVIAFFTMPFANVLESTMQRLGLGLIFLIMGILFFLIILELTGTRHASEPEAITKNGQVLKKENPKRIIEKYYKSFAIVVIILATLVFIGAGGLDVLGVSIPNLNMPVLFFLGIMVLVIFWMLAGEK